MKYWLIGGMDDSSSLSNCYTCLQDCGHDAVNDDALFSSTPRLGEQPARPSPGVTGLAFDERMTMHAERSSALHPERPDRIRAVIARLQASGLAGALSPNPYNGGPETQEYILFRIHSLSVSWNYAQPCTKIRFAVDGCMLLLMVNSPAWGSSTTEEGLGGSGICFVRDGDASTCSRASSAETACFGCADRCRPIPCREATTEELQACHDLHLVHSVARKSVEAAGISGEPPSLAYFTQDTYVNAHTNHCARLAAGSCVDVATAVTRCEADSSFIMQVRCRHWLWWPML